jgi:DNA-binding MarR family transcriptional regulator
MPPQDVSRHGPYPTPKANYERVAGARPLAASVARMRLENMSVHTLPHKNQLPCACTTVKKASRVLGRRYDAALSGAGMNSTQLAVMRAVSSRSGESLARIAHSLAMDRTSLYRALKPMVRDGWVRILDGEDTRYNTAKLTAKGARVLAAAESSWGRIQENLIKEFGHTSFLSLVRELDRLAALAKTREA